MMFRRITILMLAVSLFSPLHTAFAQKTNNAAQNNQTTMLPPVNYEEFKLPNGLRVIMHRDTSTPIVAVNVWYHVGSKNEVAGRTGFAHLFEHMMFQGSKNYDSDYFKPLQEAGANLNGSTNPDRTNYWQVVPSNFLELALFMEADRMGGLLEAMTQEKLDNQRDVVKNERRQNYDNQPYGTAGEKIVALMYPKEHPYSWTTIGSLDDLTAASMDDVKSFFREYYVPNNASLVVAGDFDPKQARKIIEKYFAPIAKGAAVKRPAPPMPKLDKEIRQSYEDAIPLPRLYMAWHTVPQYSPDQAALTILGSILSSGRGSRLQSNLVYGKQLATNAGAFHPASEIAGRFQIQATARPGKTLDEIEKELNVEIERIKKEPPTAEEMERALNQIESGAVFSLQSVGGFGGKSDQLNAYATFVGKPDYFNEDLARFRKVTARDIQRVANAYLTDKRLVMSFVPRKDRTQSVAGGAANRPTSTAENKNKKQEPDASKLPKPGPNPKFALPKIERSKLSNGLEVMFVKQSELPIVSMNLVLKSGGALNPAGKPGLSDLTADLLDKGTKTRTAIEIENQRQALGASLGAGSSFDASTVSMQTLTRNLDRALDLFSDVVLNPTFPETELETQRRQSLDALLQRNRNANAIASIVYNSILYGKNHPYGEFTNKASIESFTRNDLQKFYETYYRPNNAALIVVGDVNRADLLPKLEKAFAAWKPGEVPTGKLPDAPTREKAGIYIVDRPGSAQSVISIGQIGVARDNPDFYALQVMNTILGGGFTSRINMNLREEKGYTYGARSGFEFRRGAGPFAATAGVQTAVTKESVAEFMRELRGIRGERPVTQAELEYNKQSLIRRYPSAFETVGQISNQLASLVVYGLPDTYFNDYIGKINAVTVADVNRVATKYLDPSRVAILVVGDRSQIEPRLRELEGIGQDIKLLDAEGQPVEAGSVK